MGLSEQVLKNGNIEIGNDVTLSKKAIFDLLSNLFDGHVVTDKNQSVILNKVALLTANVVYLGAPHPVFKKRVELKSYFPEYYKRNSENNLKTFYCGIYTYKDVNLFVVYEPGTYLKKKSNNSSAHVYSVNLQYAQRAGNFTKIDANKNIIHIFDKNNFVRFIKHQAEELTSDDNADTLIPRINNFVEGLKKYIKSDIYGIDAYKELQSAGDKNANQSQWIGRYFEHIVKKYIEETSNTDFKPYADKKDGGVDLDFKYTGQENVYLDSKADKIGGSILGNDLLTIEKVVVRNKGTVFYLCCFFTDEKDSKHDYVVTKYWNQYRKDPYKTEKEIIQGFGRIMKYSVHPKKLAVIKIDETAYDILKNRPFRQGVNSNGKQRKEKLQISDKEIEAFTVVKIDLEKK